MVSRRTVIGKLAAGAAVVVATGAARTSSAVVTGERRGTASAVLDGGLEKVGNDVAPEYAPVTGPIGPQTLVDAAAPPPWELLQPWMVGSDVANGWRVADLASVADGSCVLALVNGSGRTVRIHVCRNDGAPKGLVYTDRFDLLVMNGGRGDLPTEEGLAQAVAELAHVLARNEVSEVADGVAVALLPHEERVRRFSGAIDSRLR